MIHGSGRIGIFVIVLLLALPSVSAIGLTYEKIDPIIYQPNYHQEFFFLVRNYNYEVDVGLSGDFANYATLSPLIDRDDGMKEFTLTISFPNNLNVEAGGHFINVRAAEVGTPTGGTVGALTTVQKNIPVEAYSNEKEIIVNFDIPNVNVNELVPIEVQVASYSYQDINSVYADITIYNDKNEAVLELETPRRELLSGDAISLFTTLDTSLLEAGEYRADATIYYDEFSLDVTDEFKVGILRIRINNFTDQFTGGIIDEFNAEIESLWNTPISGVYGELFIGDEKVLQTPSVALDSWKKAQLVGYWNVSYPPGKYNASFIVYYQDFITREDFTAVIVSGKAQINLTIIIIIVIILLLLLIFGTIAVKKFRKGYKIVRTKKEP